MGRFLAERVIVRKINDLEIVFWDKYSIYVEWPGYRYVFHRWYPPRDTYDDWRKFRQLLLKRQQLNFRDVFELAAVHDVLFRHADGILEWSGKPVEIRFGSIKILGVSK